MATRIVYRSVQTATDLAVIRDFTARVFCQQEATCRYLRINKEEYFGFYDEFVHPYVDLKTSIIAEEQRIEGKRQVSEIVSCLVNTPYKVEGDVSKAGRLLPVLQILHQVNQPFREGIVKKHNIKEERVLHALLGATKEGYERKRLIWNSMTMSLRMALDGRWDMAVAECSSPGSRTVCQNAVGFTEANVIRFKGFEVEGKKPFENLDGELVMSWKDLRVDINRAT